MIGTEVTDKQLAANRRYKDTVFRMLFSEKENLLSLYNAVTGRDYENAADLQIVTLENAIYMGMKNDLAFILETSIYLYEHQSTLNSNIPLRDLFILRLSIRNTSITDHYTRLHYKRFRLRNLWYFTTVRMRWRTA